MENNPNSPVFADRYRFEPVGNDWDRGRSGKTGLVYDLKEKRLGVIKRTETFSKQSTHSLQNEVKALTALKGLGVPEVYDTNQAVYDSKKYDYAVIEYIDEIRVEKNLDALSIVERAEIITQLFELLFQAHQKGIVNGDVDLKHLFWRKDKKQLVVIDWGNARLGVDPKKKTEFAYDLARAAEIIFSLVTRQGHPSATGSIALPDGSALTAGLGVLPIEFQDLCKWAPRTPTSGAQAPCTAQELFEVSKEWLKAIRSSKDYKPTPLVLKRKKAWLIGIPLAAIGVFIIFWAITKVPQEVPPTAVPAQVSLEPSSIPSYTPTVTATILPTAIPTETQTATAAPTSLPAPLEYSSLVVFKNTSPDQAYRLCWKNTVDSSSGVLVNPEGFNRKVDNTWWIFNTGDGRSIDESVKVDFGACPNDKVNNAVVDLPKLNTTVRAIALNTWVTQIQPESGKTPGGEFGLFLKGTNGTIREYTLWVDQSERLHLRIRETGKEDFDNTVLVANIQSTGRGNVYRQFRIQIFLEMDNNGSAILYLSEADSSEGSAQDLNPGQMLHIDAAVRPKLGDLQEFGLIGRGGSTRVLIWPMDLLGLGKPNK
jgi:predicted Ser/Thr protein kinase